MPFVPLFPRCTPGAAVGQPAPETWRLCIPAGPAGAYRWAQVDDYLHRARRDFLHRAPLAFSLRARVSAAGLAGTWGFGLWNDPFNLNFGLQGMARKLPTLPNTAWFFWASPPNYLALRDDHPAQGLLAATFSARPLPAPFMALGGLGLPLLLQPGLARWLRRLARRQVAEDAAALTLDPTAWHIYRLEWRPERVRFWLDDALQFETAVSPRGPLGLVLWIDNQYAAFPPDGRLSAGTLPTPQPAWLELAEIEAVGLP